MFKRYKKYLVLKTEDCDTYLSEFQKDALDGICRTVNFGRAKEQKDDLNGVFIRDNSPYYEDAWKLVEKQFENIFKQEKMEN